MKTLQNTIKITVGVFLLAALAVSCIPEQQSLGGAGQSLVKLFPSGFNMLAVDAKTTSQTGVLFEIRRDIQSDAALNETTTAVLQFDTDTAILKAYNLAHTTTSFIPLPTALATVSPALTAGKVTLVFGPGEYAKSVSLTIPSSASFDFSKQYALAFTLTSVTGSGSLSAGAGKTIITQVLAKNKYDGKYKMKGFIMRPGDLTGLEGYFKDQEFKLATAGATKVTSNRLQCWASGANVGGIGLWSFTVNETGTPPYSITITDPSTVANFLMDPAYPNRYDPATKTFYFKVNWGATIPYIRGCTDTLVYVGPAK